MGKTLSQKKTSETLYSSEYDWKSYNQGFQDCMNLNSVVDQNGILAEMAERLEQSNEAIKHLHKVYGKITLQGSLAKTANHNALLKYRRLIETN